MARYIPVNYKDSFSASEASLVKSFEELQREEAAVSAALRRAHADLKKAMEVSRSLRDDLVSLEDNRDEERNLPRSNPPTKPRATDIAGRLAYQRELGRYQREQARIAAKNAQGLAIAERMKKKWMKLDALHVDALKAGVSRDLIRQLLDHERNMFARFEQLMEQLQVKFRRKSLNL